jgi:integrase
MNDRRSLKQKAEKASQTYSKTDVRYWRDKLFQRSNEEWNCRIGFGGRQDRWPLRTANREQAAIKARDIWLSLQTHGFPATEIKFKPWTVAPEQTPARTLTVGDFIKAVTAVAVVRPTTLTTYVRKLRFLVSQVSKVKGTRAKHDYVHGGANRWREQVDKTPLAELTPEKIMQWRTAYISRRDGEPLKRGSAQQTAASIIRSAKSLFSPKVTRNLGIKLPSPLPFDGVDLGKRPRTRYQSKVNAALLATQAHAELKEAHPEQFKIFLLAFGAGLRRSEIDRLTWKHFNWQRGTISIEATEYGLTKTEGSAEEIDIGTDLLAYFKKAMPASKSEFVIESKSAPTAAPHWNRYRCDGHFKAMLEWLRAKSVTARNPLHTLRKEFGSLINQKFGIFAASAALRHSNITITREAYVDRKERIALDIGELMQKQSAA